MPSSILYRLSGIALLLGTLLIVLFSSIGFILFGGNQLSFLFAANGQTMLSHRFVEIVTGPLWLPVNVVILVGLMLIVAGLPGMYAYLAKRSGWLGLIGFVLTMVAILIFGVINQAFYTFALPFLALLAPQVLLTGQTSPALGGFYLVASLLYSVGTFLLGYTTSRMGGLLGAAGVACIIAAICNIVHLVLLSEGLWVIVFLGSVIGALAFFVGLAAFGYSLLSLHGDEQMLLSQVTPEVHNAEASHKAEYE
jgi:hypothetical protein